MGNDDQGMITVPRGNVQDLFGIVIGSLDFGWGFLDREQIEMLRATAELLGVDPMEATPCEYRQSYPHAFKLSEKARPEHRGRCYWCGVEHAP